MKTPTLLAACLLVLASALSGAMAQSGKPTVLDAVGDEVPAAFEAFQLLMGGEDNGNSPGPIQAGFRSVNWDADVVPFDMPGNFFRDGVTRGMALTTEGNEFRVSNPPEDDPGYPDNLFDSINADHPNQFQAFSPERIFSPLMDNTFEITFSVPAKGDKATVSAYGAIFVDVDNDEETYLEFFDEKDASLGLWYVPAYPQGLSFLGADLEKPVIAKVVVYLGGAKLDQPDQPPQYDVAVMDDFLFAEPVPIAKKPAAGSMDDYGR
ncbi:unnamed protein product [Ostreobium quekettii]|uniref:PEP-CTERM sorting domain-containing protein n=1 Tax=Ostreobium quekettii TaxID=121088 RepID=A0A8S1IRH7_9CHLO|nr:unnamed protein product [Ostreobium quekettii]|eukprot:evm.model.scf_1225.2 EVM.evm.TU.scf_1225.2   scf_1225:30905-32096(-)